MTTDLSTAVPSTAGPAAGLAGPGRADDPGRSAVGSEQAGTSGSAETPDRQPRTVMYLVEEMNRGGAQLRTVELMRRLDPNEFRLVFCSLSGRRGDLDDEIRSLGGEVYYRRLGPAFPLTFYLLLRRVRPQVVHAYASDATGLVFGIARMAGVPRRVAHFRVRDDGPGDTAGRPGGRTGRPAAGTGWAAAGTGWPGGSTHRRGRNAGALLRHEAGRVALDANATDLLAVCEAVMRELWRPEWRVDPRCRVIYNGLEVEPFGVAIAARRRALESVPEGTRTPVVMIHIGRPGANKNRARAMDILVALCARGVDARLQIVGRQDAAETADLLARASAGGVRDRVELLGERDDVPRLLVAASLLLVTSYHEGLPSVVLEACAVATPVLATDLPGIAEVARLLPGITMLPLSATDEIWADTARVLTAVPPLLEDRRAALRHFVRSPFTLENWQRELTAVWSRPSEPRPSEVLPERRR
ncbi:MULTISPECIES: glycosyltransferase [Protofrankia]|uniref:Glycosyl transferase group 1 n=1 Tax=Candidatus Protofrankia datiscae TaxID=2716812 RepID=F8B4T4_9ACTN|nr:MULTISPECIES: glycosyltransferase [Protofrankia]AEH09145.1 glycosyl transferase group 1 [Candidatus Protofrankia datiscae]